MNPLKPPPYHVGPLVRASSLALLAGLAACSAQQGGAHDEHSPRAGQPPRAVLTETPTASRIVAAGRAGRVLAVDRFRIGSTANEQPIYVYRVSQGQGDPDAKPGLLVVAGIDGRHETGPTVARELVGHLEREADLEHATVYVIPRVNRDAQGRDDTTAAVPGGTRTPEDADRDGRMDEDGPTDLNGDGHITMMRIDRPVPRYGIELTHVVDPDHPRLMRRADASKGEVATHALLPEAADQDGDGQMGEDGAGGVDLNRNFPYRWPEFGTSSGAYPLSEAESKALATWLLERPNVMAAIVYGPHDTIINVPASSGYDHTGRVPTGLERADKELMDRLSEQYKEATKLSQADKVSLDGSFAGWSYAHLGLVTIATNPWQRPEAPKEEDTNEGGDNDAAEAGAQAEQPAPDEPPFVMIGDYELVLTQEAIQNALAEAQTLSEAEQAERMEAFQALPAATRERIMTIAQGAPDPMAQEARPEAPRPTRRARGGGGGKDSDDAKWLAYADRVGSGFVDWEAVDHPQLGTVEVGGFVPGFKLNAPEDAVEDIVQAQGAFIEQLLAMMPRLAIDEPVVEKVGDGVWRITIEVHNEGELPTRTALGDKARRLAPYVLALDVPQDTLLSGSTINRENSIAPGGTMRAEWLVLASEGDTLNAQLRTEEFGTTDIQIELAETQQGGNR
ncbi:hypothetical protein AY599_13925 [Leptolyngbya valderiana BDU 20041]|nr:hypothetical protein AY599_13925 [Leptolyngbya valderiana BDU 20041]